MHSFLIATVALLGFTAVVLGSIGSTLKAREAALKELDQ